MGGARKLPLIQALHPPRLGLWPSALHGSLPGRLGWGPHTIAHWEARQSLRCLGAFFLVKRNSFSLKNIIIVDRFDSKLPLALDSLMNYTNKLSEFKKPNSSGFCFMSHPQPKRARPRESQGWGATGRGSTFPGVTPWNWAEPSARGARTGY